VLKIQLDSYRNIFIAVGIIGVLLFASPTIAAFIKLPLGQEFSELYILGPNHTFENMPFNVENSVRNLIYVGVGNEMGYPLYYTVYVKIGTQNESLPNIELGLPSALPPLHEYKLFLDDGATWQTPLTFQVNNLNFANGVSTLHGIRINGIDYSVNKSSAWDSNKQGYYYNLIFELWTYNSTIGISQYDNRFVLLRLNMTSN
jgi:hypothetical protein